MTVSHFGIRGCYFAAKAQDKSSEQPQADKSEDEGTYSPGTSVRRGRCVEIEAPRRWMRLSMKLLQAEVRVWQRSMVIIGTLIHHTVSLSSSCRRRGSPADAVGHHR